MIRKAEKDFHLGTISLGLLAIASTLAAVLFGLSHNPILSLSCGIVLAFFGIGVDPVIKIYGAEQYPTRMRETGIGLFEGEGRFFSTCQEELLEPLRPSALWP